MNDYLKIGCWALALAGMLTLALADGFNVLYENPLACMGALLVGFGLCKEGHDRHACEA